MRIPRHPTSRIIPPLLSVIVGAFSLAFLSNCGGGDSPTGPDNTKPASVTAATTTSLTGSVGAAVSPAPSVMVKAADGTSLVGVAVTFTATGGGGTVTGGNATTSSSGVATVGSWVLGPTAGSNTLTATVSGLPVVTFAATSSLAPTKLAVTSASTTAQNRIAFGTQPVVQLQTSAGASASLAGTVVTAAITAGGGTLGGTATATTNSSGAAIFTNLSIAGTVGARTLTFSSPGLTSATATVTLSAGTATTIAVSAGNNQSAVVGTAVATAPSVLVSDADANPVSGVSVTFAVASGGGSITGATTTTSGAGIAAVGSWTLGATAGANTLTATSTGLTGSPVTFTATGTAAGGPTIVLSTSSANFAATAGGANPASQGVSISNSGSGNLSVLSVGTITYGAGATGWLTASLNATTAPATLTMTPTVGALTPGVYTANVPVASTAAGVTNSPRTVAVSFTVAVANTIVYGTSTERVRLLDPAGFYTPTVTISIAGATQPATAGTYTSRATSVATVDASGKITAVAAGQSWVVASVSGAADSVFVLVTKSATGPVFKTDLTNYVVSPGALVTVNFSLDPRGSNIGSAAVIIGFETENSMFSVSSQTVPTASPQPTATNTTFGVYRSTVAAASGIVSPVVMLQLKLNAQSAGLAGWLTITSVGTAATDGSDMAATTTSSRYPIIIR